MPPNDASSRRPEILAAAVAVWVTGAWLAPNAWWHLWAVGGVIAALGWNAGAARHWWRTTRWAWAVAGLVGWQLLSVAWSDGGGWRQGLDAAGVLALVTAIGVVAQRDAWRHALPALVVWVAFLAAVVGLAVFYPVQGHELAGGRFRLPWVHETGLNAVLTGLLCAVGAVAALGRGVPGTGRFDRVVCLLAAGSCAFGVCATRSRGALLALLAGALVLAWFERKRIVAGLVAVAIAGGSYVLLLSSRGEAGEGLLDRGSAGRGEIYLWFMKKLSNTEAIVGTGFGTEAVIPEDVLGWFVEHPHSAYLSQFYLTGLPGLGLLLFVLGWAGRSALARARPGDAVWAALLACGGVGVLFDTSLVFSLLTAPRIEPVLVLLPAVMVMRSAPRSAAAPL